MRRRKRRSRALVSSIVALIVAVVGWWFWPRGDAEGMERADGATAEPLSTDPGTSAVAIIPEAVTVADTATDAPPDEVLAPIGTAGQPTDRAGSSTGGEAKVAVSDNQPWPPEAGESHAAAGPPEDAGARLSPNPRINASLQRYRAGEVIAARQELNRMLAISRTPAEQAELRRHLERISDATVFSKKRRPDDPLTATYTIQPGDYLITIGKQFDVPHEVIMMVNGIEDPRRIREGHKIKVLRGPFHVKIHMSEFRLDVYLQDLFVRSFPVALGGDQGTPVGSWRVKDRLANPTYYPSASVTDKRIIAPDDPTNPLGEHWIGLEGIEGDALGRAGYGIHGTIEPESIGKAVSLGCIRMHNEDVEFLYRLMLPGCSTVTTLP